MNRLKIKTAALTVTALALAASPAYADRDGSCSHGPGNRCQETTSTTMSRSGHYYPTAATGPTASTPAPASAASPTVAAPAPVPAAPQIGTAVTVTRPAAPQPAEELADTGRSSWLLTGIAVLLILAGLACRKVAGR